MASRNRIILSVIAGLALVAVAAPRAQAEELKAFIPFEFRVDTATLPAGSYNINELTGTSTVQLRSMHGGVMVMTNRSTPKRGEWTPQLTFVRYGDKYFLHEIRVSGERELTLQPSKAEREMQVASRDGKIPPASKVTVVASR
jgi:hypothetical protein